MLEVLQFIFADFWHWLGTVVLIATIGYAGYRIGLGLRGVPEPRECECPAIARATGNGEG